MSFQVLVNLHRQRLLHPFLTHLAIRAQVSESESCKYCVKVEYGCPCTYVLCDFFSLYSSLYWF